MRNRLLFSAIIVTILASPGFAEVMSGVVLTLDTPTATVNRLEIGASVEYSSSGITDSDSDTSDVTGNIALDLDYDFNFVTSVAELKTVDFTGGAFDLSDISLEFKVLGTTLATASSSGMGGRFDTILPPAPVIGGLTSGVKNFDTELHKTIIDRGSMVIESTLIPDDILTDFTVSPQEGFLTGMGTITTTLVSQSGNDYTYAVVLNVPIEYVGTHMIEDQIDLTMVASATGTLVARGEFTVAAPEPSTWMLLLGVLGGLAMMFCKRFMGLAR